MDSTRFQILTILLTLAILTAGSAMAEVVAPERVDHGVGIVHSSPPPDIDLSALDAPARTLPPASDGSADQLDAMRRWNRDGRTPPKIGFARTIPGPIIFDSNRPLLKNGQLTVEGGVLYQRIEESLLWVTSVEVEDAYRLRLKLTEVDLPTGTEMWVWGNGEAPIGFGLELLDPNGEIWTPSVTGPKIHLEVRIPGTGDPGVGY